MERRTSRPTAPSPKDIAPPKITDLAPLGAVLGGGASRRFGSPKAGALVGGHRMLDRVAAALREAGLPVGLVVAEPGQAGDFGLPWRTDSSPGMGPLGGVETALAWAKEAERPGALCVACDLPFLPAGLLRHIAERGVAGGAEAVLPASPGRWGWEPLCAFYSVAALPRVRSLAAAGERRLGMLIQQLRAEIVPPAEVRRWGDPEHLFRNVNTPADRRSAHAAAGEERR